MSDFIQRFIDPLGTSPLAIRLVRSARIIEFVISYIVKLELNL